MELILAPMDQQFGKELMWQHATPATETLRLPSLFRSPSNSSSNVERSPRLVGMSDLLSVEASPLKDAPVVARLPSIGAMMRRDENSSNASPLRVETSAVNVSSSSSTFSHDANSMSPAQKQCMDLYKQLREVPSSPLGENARNHPEYALGNLLAGAALSQLASMQQEKNDLAESHSFRVRTILPATSSSPMSDNGSDKSKRTSSAKLCGMSECRKRAKAGGYCIAHGGGLRCSEEGCQKHAVSLGLCISHGGGKRCTIDGCLNASRKNGVCWSHGGKRLCKLDGCNKGPKSGGYCWSHGGKMKK
uniref:WRKY19-like zinc finger domain-containing protein n=1 Tax=Globisporangium ultimum (strain ATCC 200006 / CBS 805.95 / DAOM BR144) TaxID=431595 RepID=K3WD46_GLOUD